MSGVIIYHAPGTRSVRPIWAAEELGIPHAVVSVGGPGKAGFADLGESAEFRRSDEWRKLSPTGKVPVMTDGTDLTMFESVAMVQYLLDRYGGGRLQPQPGTPEHALYLQ